MRRKKFTYTVAALSLGLLACDGDSPKGEPYVPEFTLPVIADWVCPAGWDTTPGFTDASGAEDVPDGMTQFNHCTPPASWSAPSGPVQLQSPSACTAGWNLVSHPTLQNADGSPYQWCEPPRVARILAPGDNADGSDYLSPIPDGASASDYLQCDVSQAMMPELWGTGCVHVGDACPAGTFPDIPSAVTGNRIYVLAGSSGGDGSEASPLASIHEGVTVATSGDVIVVGAGTYPEPLVVDKALTIWGACVDAVKVVDASSAESEVTILVEAPLLIKNLEISSTGMGIVQNRSSSTSVLEVEGVIIRRATRRAIFVLSGLAHIHDSLILNTLPSGDGVARGIQASPSTAGGVGSVRVSRVVVEGTSRGLVAWGGGSSLRVEDVLVRHTFRGEYASACLIAEAGGYITATRFQAELCGSCGLIAAAEGSYMEVEDAYIANTRSSAAGAVGLGIWIESGGESILRRAVFKNNYLDSLYVSGEGSSITVEDVYVDDTHDFEGADGYGLLVGPLGTGTANRLVVEDSAKSGVMADGGQLTATDLLVLGVQGEGNAIDPPAGLLAMMTQEGQAASITVTRGLIEGVGGVSSGAIGADAALGLTQVVIRNSASSVEGRMDLGVWGVQGAQLNLDQVVVDKTGHVGVQIDYNASLVARDLVVTGTRVRASDGGLGIGILGQNPARITLERASIVGNNRAGILFEGAATDLPGSSVDLRLKDVLVTDTSLDGSHHTFGSGVTVTNGRLAVLNNVVIRRSHALGLKVAAASQAQAVGLVITDTAPSGDLEQPGRLGWGLWVTDGADVDLTGLLIQGSRDAGAVFMNAESSFLTDVVIRDTSLGECAEYDASDPGYCLEEGQPPVSRGLALLGPSQVTLNRFELSANGSMGAQVLVGADAYGEPYTAGGLLTLSEGGILDHQIGVCLQSLPDYAEQTLQTDVHWDNQTEIAYDDMVGPLLPILPTP